MKNGVYQIRNTANGKYYIGSAAERRGIPQRWSVHKAMLVNGRHHSRHLQNAWNKHGSDAFVFEILLYCDPEYCLTYEQIALDYYKPAYNILTVAGSCRGRDITLQTRQKISDTLTGRNLSEEHKRKISTSKSGNQYWLGRKHAESSKVKISKIRRGCSLKTEHKFAIKKACLRNARRGEQHHASRLTSSQVIQIRELLDAGELQKDIANQFSIPQSLVSKIKNRKLWRDV